MLREEASRFIRIAKRIRIHGSDTSPTILNMLAVASEEVEQELAATAG